MYKVGYGFHVQLSTLVKAALIWRDGLRTFRLLQERQKRQPLPNSLLSLPPEVLACIEDKLAVILLQRLESESQLAVECDCDLLSQIIDLPEYADALKAHSVRMHSEPSFDPDLGYEEQYIHDSFCDSAEYSEMYNRVLQEHLANPPDSCPILELDHEYWYQRQMPTSEVLASRAAVSSFLDAFGLEKVTYRLAKCDESPDHSEVVISLFFEDSITATRSLERKDRYPMCSNSFKQNFTRLLRVFHLTADTRNDRARLRFPVEQFPFGEIRWLVVDLEDEKYHQVIVKQLTVEEVERHNANMVSSTPLVQPA